MGRWLKVEIVLSDWEDGILKIGMGLRILEGEVLWVGAMGELFKR